MAKFEYAPAPESRAFVNIRPSYGLFIGGEFVESTGDSTFKTISPSSEEVLAEITEAGEADIDMAVRAARRAFDGTWGRLSGAERGKYLFRIARILQERAREFALLQDPRDTEQVLAALGPGQTTPRSLKGLSCRSHRRVDVDLASLGHLREDLLG